MGSTIHNRVDEDVEHLHFSLLRRNRPVDRHEEKQEVPVGTTLGTYLRLTYIHILIRCRHPSHLAVGPNRFYSIVRCVCIGVLERRICSPCPRPSCTSVLRYPNQSRPANASDTSAAITTDTIERPIVTQESESRTAQAFQGRGRRSRI